MVGLKLSLVCWGRICSSSSLDSSIFSTSNAYGNRDSTGVFWFRAGGMLFGQDIFFTIRHL